MNSDITGPIPSSAEQPAAPVVPRDTSPTWELEMLISGAVLFSLFQLPKLADVFMDRWQPHATYESRIVLLMGYSFVKGALYTLIAAFVIHLGTRAYWVGLVGLNSVYSRGIRWERTQFGPIAHDIYKARLPALPAQIERLDNFASVIFSFAFLIVLMIFIMVPLVGVVGLVAWGASAAFFHGTGLRWIFYGLIALLVIPPLCIAIVDKRYGTRIDAHSRAGRWLRKSIGLLYYTQLIGLLAPTLLTIATNGRRKTTYALFYTVLIGSLYLVLAEWLVRRGALTVSGADYFSVRSDVNTVDYSFYESQWPEGTVNESAPSIQSDQLRDAYVRLFIPYRPDRHNDAIPARCPTLRPLETRGARRIQAGSGAADDSSAMAVLRCLTAMHAVTINGAPATKVRFRFATHPRTGVDGIVAYLPVDGLPRGENIITAMPAPRRSGSSNKRPLEPYVIPFWY